MKVKFYMCIMVFLVTLNLHANIWQGESDKSWYNADLREFQIMNAAQFKGLADLVNNDNITFEDCEVYLMSDIDLNNIQWQPIGYGNKNFGGTEFKGTFDGNNHSIQGMLITCNELSYAWGTGIGLFGNCSGNITNVKLSGYINVNNDDYYNSSAYYIGGLCGDSAGIIESCNCQIDMYVVSSNSFMSIGLCAGKTKSIQNVKVKGSIKTHEFIRAGVGGLCHRAEDINQCSVDADINLHLVAETNYVGSGGLAGYANSVNNSIFTGSFNISGQARDYEIGGLVGSSNLISNSIFAPHDVNMYVTFDPSWMYGNSVGPICSPKRADTSLIENCYYTNNLNTTPQKGYEVSQEFLCSGNVLDGFSSEIWLFKAGSLPSLRSLMSSYLVQTVVSNGFAGIEVKEGDSLNYIITPDYGWKIYRFYLNDQDYTDFLNQNRYKFDYIDRDYQIKVIFEKDGDNAVRGVTISEPCKITMENNRITASDVKVGQVITVVSQNGMIEYQITAKDPTVSFEISKGIHIINIGEKSFKILN